MDKFTLPMNLLWMETALLFYAEKAQNQEILKVRYYNNFLPVTSKSDQLLDLNTSIMQELWWLKCKRRHNNQEILSLGCGNYEEFEQYARQYISPETDHQYLEAASTQQSENKLWETVSIGNKWKFDSPI